MKIQNRIKKLDYRFSVTHVKVRKYSHFSHIDNRQCILSIGKNTSITSRHYFDCNGGIYIGDYCTIAGFETAFMTHSIDLKTIGKILLPLELEIMLLSVPDVLF